MCAVLAIGTIHKRKQGVGGDSAFIGSKLAPSDKITKKATAHLGPEGCRQMHLKDKILPMDLQLICAHFAWYVVVLAYQGIQVSIGITTMCYMIYYVRFKRNVKNINKSYERKQTISRLSN